MTRLLTVAALLVLVLGIGAGFALPRLDAIGTLLRFAAGGAGEDGELQEGMRFVQDARRTGFHRLLVARPEGAGAHPALLFLHGVAVKGLDDARVIEAIAAFRDAGFVVVAPQVRVLVSPPENDRDLERVADLLSAIHAGVIEGVDPDRVGVIGISVGGGMALRAVARHRARGGAGPRAVLAIGAPDDLKRLIPVWFSLPRPDLTAPASAERSQREEARFARNVVWRAALRRRVRDPQDRDRLRTWLETNLDPTFAPRGLHTDDAVAFVRLVGRGPETWRGVAPALVEDAWPLMSVFSPAASGAELAHLAGVAVFLLHGTGDPLVPVSEMDALAGRLAAHTLAVTLASRMLGHVDVETVGFREQAEHVVFMDDFFDMVKR